MPRVMVPSNFFWSKCLRTTSSDACFIRLSCNLNDTWYCYFFCSSVFFKCSCCYIIFPFKRVIVCWVFYFKEKKPTTVLLVHNIHWCLDYAIASTVVVCMYELKGLFLWLNYFFFFFSDFWCKWPVSGTEFQQSS